MYTYTLAFVCFNDQCLVLNRKKSPWLGMWNGLGGKIQEGETPIESIQRELFEEMGMTFPLEDIQEAGVLTWDDFEAEGQGIYLFVVQLKKPFETKYPYDSDEGILAIKSVDWLIHEHNLGVAPNIKYFLKPILSAPQHVHCHFELGQLKSVKVTPL
jgi:8-oxo-dGTP diphosphatase